MRKFIKKYLLDLLPSLASWVMLLATNLYQELYQARKGEILFFIPPYVQSIFLFLFLVFLYQAGKSIARKETKRKSLEVIWLVTSVGGTGIILNALSNWIKSIYIANYSSIFWYNLDKNIGVLTSAYFFVSLILVFRQLILFRSTFWKQGAWKFFDGLIWVGFLGVFEEWVPVPKGIFYVFMGIGWVTIFYLSIHTEWVAYLNFKEKLMGIFFLLVILVIELSYLFLINTSYSEGGVFNLWNAWYLDLIYWFSIVYTLFSILVLAFNLPTSSIYELRELERRAISKMNQVILKSSFDVREVYEVLMEMGVLYSKAEWGWIKAEHSNSTIPIAHNIQLETALEIQAVIDQYWLYQGNNKSFLVSDTEKLSSFKSKFGDIKSFWVTKIATQDKVYGELVLGWRHQNVFESELHSFLSVLSEQAAIAIENKALFKRSIILERYDEQIKIAKEFQDKVLPEVPSLPGFDLHAVTMEADEVGGDYVEIYRSEGEYVDIVIADVAGKGTTAAFYMAELKGMLQILFPLQLDLFSFAHRLNSALSHCLSSNLFITLNVVRLNVASLEGQLLRAGHMPLLHFSTAHQQVLDYQPKGIGLGILRKNFSPQNFELHSFQLRKGDVLVLFTDGVIEARSPQNAELGIETLKTWIHTFHGLSCIEINYSILEQMMAFTNQKKIQDDYTLLTLKVL